jgi:hypothetical protein
MSVGLRCHYILRHLVACCKTLEARFESQNEICKRRRTISLSAVYSLI